MRVPGCPAGEASGLAACSPDSILATHRLSTPHRALVLRDRPSRAAASASLTVSIPCALAAPHAQLLMLLGLFEVWDGRGLSAGAHPLSLVGMGSWGLRGQGRP